MTSEWSKVRQIYFVAREQGIKIITALVYQDASTFNHLS